MPSGVYQHRPHSLEARQKMSKAYTFTPKRLAASLENVKKITPFPVGEAHPNWKGGISASSQKEYLRRIRASVIEALGGKCSKCEFGDARALQIDHINGGGSKERKERKFKGNFHKHVLSSFLKNEGKYQLLCANCNWIKRSENNERTKITL